MKDFRDQARQEFKGAGKEIGKEVGRLVFSAFIDWVQTRPLKRLIQRRRRQRAEDD